LDIEEENSGRFLIAPGMLDSVDQEVDGICCCAAWTASELVAWKELVLVAEVCEVFSDEGGEEFANSIKQANGPICFWDVITWLVRFPEHDGGRFEPIRVVSVVFKDPFEDIVEVVNEEVRALS
jgi:hypothetical protein